MAGHDISVGNDLLPGLLRMDWRSMPGAARDRHALQRTRCTSLRRNSGRIKAEQGGEINGGGGEIRTHEGRKSLAVFKTAAFNHSATPPKAWRILSDR